MRVMVVEDNQRLREGLCQGLASLDGVSIAYDCDSGEGCLTYALGDGRADVVLMDVALAGQMTGIEAAVALRREFPRFPVVFYSIQDDDAYYRAFRESGILSHYAYVRKSNYLLPDMIAPLLRDAVSGRGFIDAEIEARVQEVRRSDLDSPMQLLEPNECAVALMIARGMTNEQIAIQMGFKDKRTISRTAGQIYASWGLADTPTATKVARTRAAMIVHAGRLLMWDDNGTAFDELGNPWKWPFDA